MTFAFSDTNTERVDLSKILTDPSVFPLEYVKKANTARQRVCDALASQPASEAVLQAIDEYLPYVQFLLDHEESFKGNKKVNFSWRSVISKGIRMSLRDSVVSKPLINHPSIWFESINTLVTYALTLANMANKRIGDSFSSASEAACTEAADLLCRAAGVLRMTAVTWCPRWSDKDMIVPECSTEVIMMLSNLMIADANRAALAKAEKKGMSVPTLIKVGTAVMNHFAECSSMLGRIPKRELGEIADSFKSYIEDGHRIAEAAVYKRFGTQKHEDGENGVAIAALAQANNQLVKCLRSDWAPYKKIAAQQMPEIEELMARVVRLNNNITYQKVPELSEVKGHLPPGFVIVEVKGFTLPSVCEPECKSDDQN